MKVAVRYFAAARELRGIDEEEISLPDGSDVEGLFSKLAKNHAALAPFLDRMRAAVNSDFANRDTLLQDGDEIVLLPPVAGGSDLIAVQSTPLSIDECYRSVSHAGAGGVAIFVGVVRDHADGKSVARLDYESYEELAVKETKRIVAEIIKEIPGVRIAAVHRVGELQVGDLAVVVAASAPHRAQAFQACRAAIDRIKDTVPIWKKEWAPDGTANWVNLGKPEP